jgi:ribosomal protein S18 acetylase RimI-like enzyme
MKDLARLPTRIGRVKYRDATARDIEAIAALHADSWRRHYRGAYSDAFLDGDVLADRLSVWTERLTRSATQDECTIVAERDGSVVGIAHTILDYDPTWGALLDNLHVRHDLKGLGVGTRLMVETAQAVIERRPSSGLYLWVLEGNKAAQAFYEARGGKCVGRQDSEPPGGGTVTGLRYVWPDPSVLLVTEAVR